MSSVHINPFGEALVDALASSKVAIASKGLVEVYYKVGYPNYPESWKLLGSVTNGSTELSVTNATELSIRAGAQEALYEVGVDAFVSDEYSHSRYVTPGVLNATGALTAAMMVTGIVTSTTAAAVAGTVPTGTVMDAALLDMQINDSFDWSVIATGANAFTVTAATGHTVVGTAAVATATSGRFRTVKTAAATYITYRLS